MVDIRTKADLIRREATTKALAAQVYPYSSAKQSMDEWDAGMAAAELRQNDITLCQLVPLVRSLASRVNAAGQKIPLDGVSRRSLARQAEELQAAVDEILRTVSQPVTYQQAAE